MHPLLEWLALAAGTFLLAAVPGAWANRAALRTWYPRLRQPRLQPPAAVFPVVWTILYLLMATAFWAVLQRRAEVDIRPAAAAYGAQLALNTAWAVLFFKLRRVRLAALDAVLLCSAVVAMIVLFRAIVPWTQWLLLPYLGWVSFAAYLTRASGRLNPEVFRDTAAGASCSGGL